MNNNSQKRNNKMMRTKPEKLEESQKLTSSSSQLPSFSKKDAPSKILPLLRRLGICLMVFFAGVVTGLLSSSQRSTLTTLENYNDNKIYAASASSRYNCSNISQLSHHCDDCLSEHNIVRPKELNHKLTDDQLLWRASMTPKIVGYPYKRVPKVAFMFLTRGPLPLLPLWERFFDGSQGLFSIYVHTQLGFVFDVSPNSVFFRRQIPSKEVSWGNVSLADAEKRLLANALLDFSNERFVLLSESCIPVYNFKTVYKYLTESSHSFVQSLDDQSRFGRGRYDRHMGPKIKIDQWRKGAQWFEISRALAIEVISDYEYYDLFRKYCHPPCFPDEHYFSTYLNIFHAPLNSNRTLTWVDWSERGPHPTTFVRENITEGFIQRIRIHKKKCLYNSEITSVCYLFARKFAPSSLEPLLDLSSKVMGF